MQKKISKAHGNAIVVIGAILALTGGALLFFFIKGKKLPNANGPDSVPNTPASTPKQSVQPASDFPLKNGSKNDLVKQLQALLGVTADGIFGPKTMAALTTQTGKTQVSSQADFNQVIAQLQSKPVIAAGKTRADLLTSQYNASATSQMMALENVTATQVIQDDSGALQPTGKGLAMQPDTAHDHSDYVPQGSTTAGYLLFQVNSADLAGLYKVDPNKVTIV